jgi:putative ABC transport system permease protein
LHRLAPYILKSLWRNRTRTLLTVSGAAVALFVYCLIGAVGDAFDRFDQSRRADRAVVVFQANRFCPATSHLPEDYGQTIAKLPGVADAIPIQVYTNNCRASLNVIVFYGLPPEKLRAVRKFELVSGDWAAYVQRRDAALVGSAVAARRGIKLGQTFTIGEVKVHVAGIFRSEQASEENFIYTHLDFLQRTPGLNAIGTVTHFEAPLRSVADPEAVCAAIDQRFRRGPVATDTRSKAAFQASTVTDLVEMVSMLDYLGYACIGLVVTLVATTTLMAVQDRVREHAVLQTLGFKSRQVFCLVLAESAAVSFVGGLAGVAAAAALLAIMVPSVGAEAVMIVVRPSWLGVGSGLAASALVGVCSGWIPAWQAARADIVTALRGA